MLLISAVQARWQPDAELILRRPGLYLFLFCCVCLFAPSLIKGREGEKREALWPGGGGVEPFGFNHKKKKKNPRGQTEFSGLVFCRLVCLWVAATLGTAQPVTSERRGPVCRVGGQMEGGCTAQLSSAGTQPLPSSRSRFPAPFIYSFSQSFLSLLSRFPLPSGRPPFHSRMLFISVDRGD